MKNSLTLLFSLLTMTAIAQLKPVSSGAYLWNEIPVRTSPEREARKIMEGSSPYFEFLEIHATTQAKGAKPSAPHAQEDIEEVIIVKEGTMEFTIDGESAVLGAGSIVLIPPLTMQSLVNIGDGPLTYYVIMFRAKKPMNIERGNAAGGHLFLNADSLTAKPNTLGSRTEYFDRPTVVTEHFEMHVTQLDRETEKQEPHDHLESEIVLMLEGETEMTIDGKAYKGIAGDLFLMTSTKPHSIRNTADKPSKYFSFKWK